LVENIAGHLKDAQEFIQKRAVHNFTQADPEYGRRVQAALHAHKMAQSKVSKCQIDNYHLSADNLWYLSKSLHFSPFDQKPVHTSYFPV
jgi:hypothetical protein